MNKYLINDKSSRELSQAIVETIRSAKKYIKTGNFLFQDVSIINELKEAMKRGIAVFILSNIAELERDSASYKEGEAVNMHLSNLKKLHNFGAHCRSLDDLHAKFIIADGDTGILMSANFAPTSLDNNIETGIILDSPEIRDLEYTFDILYINSDVYLQESETRHQSIRSKSPVRHNAFDAEHISSKLCLTVAPYNKTDDSNRNVSNLRYCDVHSIYDKIIEIIDNSNEYLYIVTWHFKALRRLPKFIDAVKRAIERGVWISLYSNTKQENFTQKESLSQIKFLESIGCKSRGDDNNHSKCVISESEGIVFTANIDGYRGLTSGFEVGCTLEKESLDKAREFVEKLIG